MSFCRFLFNSPNFNSPDAIPNAIPNPNPNPIIGIRRIEIRQIERTPFCPIQDGGKAQARRWLQEAVRSGEADFRRRQWEAIDIVVNQKRRLLVVERTGWGKSIVYFLSARLLRERQRKDALTVVVSPLISLMRNQIEQAQRVDVRAVTINHLNSDEWQQSYEVCSVRPT